MLVWWLAGVGLLGVQAHDAVSSSPRLACNATYLCSEADRLRWDEKRTQAKKIAKMVDMANRGFFIDSRDLELLQLRDEFCTDTHTAGFLLDEEDGWPMACLSVGSDGNGTCAPGPPSEYLYDYIQGHEWREKVRNVRTRLGCSYFEIQSAIDIGELYICRERCMHAGIGYFFSLSVMLALLTTIASINMS